MAPGYVIAVALETAGLAGMVLGLVVARRERLARAAGLRGVLGTGGPDRQPANPLRVVRVNVAPAPALREVEGSARSALRRALLAA